MSQPNKNQVAELRKNGMVRAWIDNYSQNRNSNGGSYPDCIYCDWPHNEHVLCGVGATFGRLRIGRDWYFVDASNVEYFVHVRSKPRRGFHWRDDIYFERLEDGTVEITYFARYNNSPQEHTLEIPPNEWASIVLSMTAFNERPGDWDAWMKHHTGAEDMLEGKRSGY